MAIAHRDAAIPRQRLEQSDIVETQVAREVFLRAEVDAFLAECLLEGAEVKGLAVGDHAVEIEDDRLQRAGHTPGAFSPASIGTFNLFDGGGNGHSYDAL